MVKTLQSFPLILTDDFEIKVVAKATFWTAMLRVHYQSRIARIDKTSACAVEQSKLPLIIILLRVGVYDRPGVPGPVSVIFSFSLHLLSFPSVYSVHQTLCKSLKNVDFN